MIEWKGPAVARQVDHRDVLVQITFHEDGAANFTYTTVLDGYKSANICVCQFDGIKPTGLLGGMQCAYHN